MRGALAGLYIFYLLVLIKLLLKGACSIVFSFLMVVFSCGLLAVFVLLVLEVNRLGLANFI